MNKEFKLAIAGGLLLVGIIVLLVINPFVSVGAGERGVMLTWGAFTGQVLEPGLHFKTPVAQSVVHMDVRTAKLEIEASEAYSKDLQNVTIHSVVNYSVDPKAAGTVYQKYGLEYEAKILKPNLEANVKAIVAKYTAEELLSKRADVQTEIATAYRNTIPVEFIVTNYSLVNESFSATYEAAIEKKQVAQQDAERANNELKRAKIDAEKTVVEATAQAQAIKIQAEAVTQQGGADYVQLQAINKWDGKLPTQFIPGQTLPFLNLTPAK